MCQGLNAFEKKMIPIVSKEAIGKGFRKNHISRTSLSLCEKSITL